MTDKKQELEYLTRKQVQSGAYERIASKKMPKREDSTEPVGIDLFAILHKEKVPEAPVHDEKNEAYQIAYELAQREEFKGAVGYTVEPENSKNLTTLGELEDVVYLWREI
jgi:hypothetical protein